MSPLWLQDRHIIGRVTLGGAPAIVVLLGLAQKCLNADERLKTLKVCSFPRISRINHRMDY